MEAPPSQALAQLSLLGDGFRRHGEVFTSLLLSIDQDRDRLCGIGGSAGVAIWRDVLSRSSSDTIVPLAMGCVLAERELRWVGGSGASSVWLFETIQEMIPDVFAELAEWATDHTTNPWMPVQGQGDKPVAIQRSPLAKLDAAHVYSRAWNTLCCETLIPWLADDVRYVSQHVLDEMDSRDELVAYLRGRMSAYKSSNVLVQAELGETRTYPAYQIDPEPCALVAQNSELPRGTVLFKTRAGFIQQITMCGIVPHPSTTHRTGIYPT